MMGTKKQFPGVNWIWSGAISFVYEVHPDIVVKVPKLQEYARDQFDHELKVYDILSKHEPCPYLIQCFHYSNDGIFLEYMTDSCLSLRLQDHQTKYGHTAIVEKVNKYEPLSLRLRWMNDLAQAAAFLESISLVHGDLRPENVLLNGNQIKLTDFDNTVEIGTVEEMCTEPYGRNLNEDEADLGEPGTPGILGARTEQFALGGLYYFINYGFEMYSDRLLAENEDDHDDKVGELLQAKKFPALNRDLAIDTVILMCWHNKYNTISEVSKHTGHLLNTQSYYDSLAKKPDSDTIADQGSETFEPSESDAQKLESADAMIVDRDATEDVTADNAVPGEIPVEAEAMSPRAGKTEDRTDGAKSGMEEATSIGASEHGASGKITPVEGTSENASDEERALGTSYNTEGAMDGHTETNEEGTTRDRQEQEGAIGSSSPEEGATATREQTEEGANQDIGDLEEGDSGIDMVADNSAVAFESKKALCQDLEKRGLLKLLCSGTPDELGFRLMWYRRRKSAR
ncbi:kinase-like domain-containing protein [Aspergillus venezuelensis]